MGTYYELSYWTFDGDDTDQMHLTREHVVLTDVERANLLSGKKTAMHTFIVGDGEMLYVPDACFCGLRMVTKH
jgi:hypothetical protein